MENQNMKIKELINKVKLFLASMEDGNISVSAYDTAWVALIDHIHQTGVPQFSSSLSWIVDNQLTDGSWGYDRMFMVSDRLINTLACVIALKKWNTAPDKFEKGLAFVRANLSRVGEGHVEHMLAGFEVVFPSLLDLARQSGIELPDCSTALQDIYAKRTLKLSGIPWDRVHEVTTILLYSLEGMEGLDWKRLVKLQHENGSFMTSPSATAFAFMQTKDNNCLTYLNKVTQRFNGGVPTFYPIDLFEQVWVVDRLQRLGISRFFKEKIQENISHLRRYWTKDGISWARNSRVNDLDCTSMGFRLLRSHGYQVSPDAFRGCKRGLNEEEFVCYEGQWLEAISVMSSLYKATQLMFPQEKILHDAKNFTSKFLRQKQTENKFIDKWLITKDLPGEVAFMLNVPWYACLPRLEATFFIEHYGGEDVVWLGKSLYKVPLICNDMYLELAKADFNHCQQLHRNELIKIHEWYDEYELGEFGVAKNSIRHEYFVAAATIFEPERSVERLAWAKTAIFLKTVATYFLVTDDSYMISSFTAHFDQQLVATRNDMAVTNGGFEMKTTSQKLIYMLQTSFNQFSLDAKNVYGEDITHQHLCRSWEKWLLKWQDDDTKEYEGYHGEAEVLVNTINLMGGGTVSSNGCFYDQISKLMNKICSQLVNHQKQKNYITEVDGNSKSLYGITTPQIERDMEELVEMVLNNSPVDDMSFDMKQTFLAVTKSFYYTTFFDPDTVESHIARVLFEKKL